ncbi:MAG: aconitate hydratase B, partial [Succinivibrio sp.]
MKQTREALGIPPLALNEAQVQELCSLLRDPPEGSAGELRGLLENRVNPGVDASSKVKAEFLYEIASGAAASPAISPEDAVAMLGGMKGGYNVAKLVSLLQGPLAPMAREALSSTLLVYDAFEDVAALARKGVEAARGLMADWAEARWFASRPVLEKTITLTVFKVSGEINTDDFSPAPDAWSRPDIPLHARAMFKMARPGLEPDEPGAVGPLSLIGKLKSKGFPLLFAGDVVGTGSSRKSAANSLIWHIGRDIPGVPNKREGGFVAGGKIAPIFYTTLEDSGALPIEADVSALNLGDVVDLNVYDGTITSHDSGKVLCTFALKTPTLLDEVRAGGRISLIIGKALTKKAREALGMGESTAFAKPRQVRGEGGFTRAQKIVGRACGMPGVRPGQYVEVKISTVGSQDTTGPMTRDELSDLACLKFQAPLVMQSFCHTAAYPRKVDVKTHKTLPQFFQSRGGVALRPGDGVIHSWLNRMCLPDTV